MRLRNHLDSIIIQAEGFTLIEMLIVIVIIGILAAALVPRLQAVQGRARDTKRKTDLNQIFTAIEIYKTDNSAYPNAGLNCGCYRHSNGVQPWLPGISSYMTSIPVDPINVGTASWEANSYLYTFGNVFPANDSYTLNTKLENLNDPDRSGVKNYYGYQSSYFTRNTYSTQIYEMGPKRFGP